MPGRTHLPPVWILKMLSVDLWRIPGTLALLVVVPMALRPQRAHAVPTLIDRRSATPELLGWLAGIAGVLAMFAWLPLDSAYLIPAAPLAIMLLAHRLRRAAFSALCVALLASPWLLKIKLAESGGEPTSGVIGPVAVGGEKWVLDVLRGPALENQYRRHRMIRERDRILERARAFTGQNVLIVHGWMPVIRTTLNGWRLGESTFVESLDDTEAIRLRARGVTVVDLFP